MDITINDISSSFPSGACFTNDGFSIAIQIW